MKKKIACLLAAVCLLLCLAPAQRAQAVSDVCFISVNDRLLDMTGLAVYFRAVVCAVHHLQRFPYKTISILPTATPPNSSKGKAVLLRPELRQRLRRQQQILQRSGATRQRGVAYVMAFVCRFGLNWSYIEGSGYGDICRIKDATVILPDSQFLSAASDGVALQGLRRPPEIELHHAELRRVSAARVYPELSGPAGDAILDALETAINAAFFSLSYKDILNGADTVRRIAGRENTLGILCDSYDEYQEASAALTGRAIKTVLVATPDVGAPAS